MTEAVSRTARNKARTKRRILDAALDEFNENGFSKVRVKDITERADVGYGTFYQYFNGKKDVVSVLIIQANETLLRENQSGSYDLLKTKDRFYYHVIEILEFYRKYSAIYKAVDEMARVDEGFQNLDHMLRDNLSELISHSVHLYKDRGLCRDDVDEQTIKCIYCMIDGCGREIIAMEDPDIQYYSRKISESCYCILFSDETVEEGSFLVD